jgi:hypothetical protein
MSTANLVAAALNTKLTGGTALTALLASGTASVFRNQAPENAHRPFIVFSAYAGGPLNITPSDLRDVVYFVRGYADSANVAGQIDAAASALLHKGTISVTGYTCMNVWRDLDLELVENPPDGKTVFMVGGTYRISLDA